MPPRKRNRRLDFAPAHAWAAAFKDNRTLVHLDLSHNYFDSQELEVVSQGLDKNHTILGIHFGGNEGDIDALGFLKTYDDQGLVHP